MKAYVVMVISNRTNRAKVSQDAYSTLEAAQAFIEKRSGNPEKFSDWVYTTKEMDYEIVEVSIEK